MGLAVTARPALDLLDGSSYVDGAHERYAWFREHEPVAWDDVNELWGVFRYDDIEHVETHDEVFISSDTTKGGYRPNIPADPALLGTDNPLHAQRRKLVSRRFTPRAVAAHEVEVRAIVTDLIDAALAAREVEIVSQLASVLPARMIGRLLGFPDDAWPQLRDWSEETIMLGGGPRYIHEAGVNSAFTFMQMALELYAQRMKCPANDVMTLWTQGRIDDRPISEREVASDCLALLDGGAETTRTVLARTILELIARPDQWDLLRNGADLGRAVEEFIRWVSPIHNMCRVAARDYDLGGVTIRKGQQVVLMYGSANRDPSHFVEPERFDVTRHPNDHLAFGVGTHFCLGAGLARLEIRVFFEELLRRVSAMRLVEAPVEMPNAFVYGLRSAVVEFTPA